MEKNETLASKPELKSKAESLGDDGCVGAWYEKKEERRSSNAE